jgi:cytochrome c peroxidase
MKTAFILVVITALVGSLSHKEPTPYSFPKLPFFPKMPRAIDNPVSIEGAKLGRFLFYDPILSQDSSLSCASCHQQQVAFSDAPSTFSKGDEGRVGKRNTPPLFNLAWYPSMFWDGRAVSIETQVFHPVRAHEEMNLSWKIATKRISSSNFYLPLFQAAFGDTVCIDSVYIAKAIAQFERTLISNNSKYDQVLQSKVAFTEDELAGYILVNETNKGECLACHSTDADALGTLRRFSNNGLDAIFEASEYIDKGLGAMTGNPKDNGRFKIPSLRNVGLTAPYMHDGRFETLEEVVAFYNDSVHYSANIDHKMGSAQRGGMHLTPLEQQQIVAFLHTLSDSSFIQNPAFSNPF